LAEGVTGMNSPDGTWELGEEFPISELMERFRQLWADRREEIQDPITRIASFNLLVVSRNGRESALPAILGGLKESHPARVIWASIDQERSWEESTAQMHIGCRCDNEQVVCSEQLQLLCGEQYERLASLLMPMIRAGLSSHLIWWNAGPPEGALFERLSDRCNLILLAQTPWPQLQKLLPGLWSDPEKSEHAYYPLSWFQLTPARQAIAAAFGRGPIKLTLSSDPTCAVRGLMESWIRALVPSSQMKSINIRHDGAKEECLLERDGTTQVLKPQGGLTSVRQALDRPQRDPVFQKMIEYWKVTA